MELESNAERSGLGGIESMGLGDEIMASGQVKEAYENLPEDCQIVLGRPVRNEAGKLTQIIRKQDNRDAAIIFQNNPKLTTNVNWHKKIHFIESFPGSRPYIINKGPLHDRQRCNFNWDFKAIPGEIFFNSQEKQRIKELKQQFSNYILLNPVTINGFCEDNKNWGASKWLSLAEMLHSKGYKTIQTLYGSGHDGEILNVNGTVINPRLPDTFGIKTRSFRDMLCVIAACSFSITTEGAVHHAAAALGKKSVVILGGRVPPSILGYDFHSNFYVEEVTLDNGEKVQSPCGEHHRCEHCRICMEKISAEDVFSEAERLANELNQGS